MWVGSSGVLFARTTGAIWALGGVEWAGRVRTKRNRNRFKCKRLRAFKRFKRWWDRLLKRAPNLFAHWKWMHHFVWTR